MIDACENNTCNAIGGKCSRLDFPNWSCECNDGFSGEFCDDGKKMLLMIMELIILSQLLKRKNKKCLLDACNPSPCINGTCVRQPGGNYSCACHDGYFGSLCQNCRRKFFFLYSLQQNFSHLQFPVHQIHVKTMELVIPVPADIIAHVRLVLSENIARTVIFIFISTQVYYF